ncbi:MAG: hypothetical protein CM15mP103_01860 [Gammaproteobacteria bacterium]|nr:MAG: hypothetical protein CM15mP103_01860 [Gammaproteobacteria bacterium]
MMQFAHSHGLGAEIELIQPDELRGLAWATRATPSTFFGSIGSHGAAAEIPPGK